MPPADVVDLAGAGQPRALFPTATDERRAVERRIYPPSIRKTMLLVGTQVGTNLAIGGPPSSACVTSEMQAFAGKAHQTADGARLRINIPKLEVAGSTPVRRFKLIQI